ncbi:MAG TPA: adenylate/guanylate cyclase domain-containing protein, partial [Bacteroidales bacterium]|nr:adenylate/guanylate cyclase domain-containing protein [Bacteroidales bacterium]
MSYSVRLRIVFGVILFLILLNATANSVSRETDVVPSLKRVLIKNDSVIYNADSSRLQDTLLNIVLRYRNNNVRFELQPDDSVAYQFFLEGYDKQYTNWGKTGFKEYTNLPAGKYLFKIKYIINRTSGGEVTLISLKILPLWYFSRPAIFLYIIALSLIIWVFYDFLNLRFARKLYSLEQIINKRTEDLIIEKEKTEALLANVLPKNTASEIMEKGKATKIKYNFVTVLFSDIQGFTKIAEEMNPEVLIDELDKFFFHFDSVVEKFGIEKIKTIGDAYMCAGGIPEKNRTNPVEVILAALEMRGYMDKLKEASELEGMKFWDIRMGIHTGT